MIASIPSPGESIWHIGPFPIRAYAIAIIIGIIVAWFFFDKRYRAKGGKEDVSVDLTIAGVVLGIIGARAYHVATDYQLYFGEGKNPLDAFKVWNGGLGIWGGIAFGALGVYLMARHKGLRIAPIADAVAPALPIGQAIGRFGNYFNQELYGKPTDLPWALEIDNAHLIGGYTSGTTFHPTFLYESLWCLLGVVVLLRLEKRFDLRGGQLFASYLMWYTLGRFWIEALRIDTAHHVLGLRLNMWTSLFVFVCALIVFVVLRRRFKAKPVVDNIMRSDVSVAHSDDNNDDDDVSFDEVLRGKGSDTPK